MLRLYAHLQYNNYHGTTEICISVPKYYVHDTVLYALHLNREGTEGAPLGRAAVDTGPRENKKASDCIRNCLVLRNDVLRCKSK